MTTIEETTRSRRHLQPGAIVRTGDAEGLHERHLALGHQHAQQVPRSEPGHAGVIAKDPRIDGCEGERPAWEHGLDIGEAAAGTDVADPRCIPGPSALAMTAQSPGCNMPVVMVALGATDGNATPGAVPISGEGWADAAA
ncbi:MAG: hypothetical protein WKF78_13000 [Candidatus Limnocylindrales bacterium]